MDKETGFTIIELLTVIVIIGVLLTVGVVSLAGIQASARDTERGDDVANIARVLEQDYNEQVTAVAGKPSPSYPSTNTFIPDARAGTGTAASTDATMFEAPQTGAFSLNKATTTDPQSPNGPGSPELNAYYYQALTDDNLLCQDSSQTCVRYQLFYRREQGNCPGTSSPICIIRSIHQQ